MENWDTIVIGGGPAGAIAGLSLAAPRPPGDHPRKIQFPRFHVGESLLPVTFDHLNELGLIPALREIPHVAKFGAEFAMGNGGSHMEIDFADGFCNGCESFNIERSIFDAMLLREARKGGVEVRRTVPSGEFCRWRMGKSNRDRCRRNSGTIPAGLQRPGNRRRAASQDPQAGGGAYLKKVAYGGHFQKVWRPTGRQAGYSVHRHDGRRMVLAHPHHRAPYQRRNGDGCRNRPPNNARQKRSARSDAGLGSRTLPGRAQSAWKSVRAGNKSGLRRFHLHLPALRRRRLFSGRRFGRVHGSDILHGNCLAVDAAITAAKQVDDILAGPTFPGRARKEYIARVEK